MFVFFSLFWLFNDIIFGAIGGGLSIFLFGLRTIRLFEFPNNCLMIDGSNSFD